MGFMDDVIERVRLAEEKQREAEKKAREEAQLRQEEEMVKAESQRQLADAQVKISGIDLEYKVKEAMSLNTTTSAAISQVVDELKDEAEKVAPVRTLEEKIANHEALSVAEEALYEKSTGRDVGSNGFIDNVQNKIRNYAPLEGKSSSLRDAIDYQQSVELSDREEHENEERTRD